MRHLKIEDILVIHLMLSTRVYFRTSSENSIFILRSENSYFHLARARKRESIMGKCKIAYFDMRDFTLSVGARCVN